MKNGAFEGTEMAQGDRVEIGRDPNCTLQLDDDSVSRRHAVLFEHDGKLAVQDLGSANGTRVNGEPVGNGRYLGPRDDIAIGAFTLKVKVMSGSAQKPAPAPAPVAQDNATRVYPSPQLGNPASVSVGAAPNNERTAIAMPEAAATIPSIPPIPPVSEPEPSTTAPVGQAMNRGSRPAPRPQPMPDVTAPDGLVPAAQVKRERPPPVVAPQAQLGATMPELGGISDELEIPRSPINTDGTPIGAMVYAPKFLAEELVEDDDEPVWSLVQRLVRPSTEKNKDPLVEVVHYRGEVVVDHQVLHPGDTYKLGGRMSRAELRDRGIGRVIPLVRLKSSGVAEIFQREEVSGRLLRGNQQVDLSPGKGAAPITDGELASLKVGNERVFVRFAGPPKLVWTKDDAAEDRFARRLNGIAAGSSVGLFMLFAVVSWIYQYRNADSEVIKIDDDGFADVEIKELKMPEPPKEEPKPVEPTEVKQDPTQPKDKAPPQVAQPDKTPPKQEEAPKKPGVMDILNNIPKVDSSASNQNLTAALSNINAVRVPGGAASVKVSSLIGKAPTSGVQIGGAAGGLSTSGINSLIRKDGQAGALGGKGDHAIQGKVTTLARQLTKTGQGELSKEEIQKVINQHIGEIQFCYEKQLNKQPGLAGRVVLEWGVNPAGHVSVVKVSQSTMNSADATNCMMQKLKTWKFPPPRGGAVTIVFPFVFNTV